ncbi:YbhB/YbcL family Raf kinase inhibitor-like protein [Phormidium sp. CCY1219]|uniref:YbhB/YbcL family Raf kinase inhibitor-like protein n=1 Tax=Phormidium sp. CCY1219 TaxID=2886104 RepID=UPI002D1EF825|nr:YbhB/YbcL family Raf kinase inhibitor-like protein [Phormidium sp. CCY1219]MEB3827685.1 YbhB/YbcL family Raf kinase inhibitor-like protein [Phormidium sp. CCY1219]
MEFKSPAFFIGNTLPSKYTCDGEDISPPLSWGTPPEGTSSFTLIVEDPDAPNRSFTHWLVYDIPANIRHLPEGVPTESSLDRGGVQGKNDFGKVGYGGPCPPSGTHRYFFKLYALDSLLSLAPGASKAEVKAAMEGHILTAVELMGRYAKQSA